VVDDRKHASKHRYVLIKVCTQSAVTVKREVEALNHINALPKSKHVYGWRLGSGLSFASLDD